MTDPALRPVCGKATGKSTCGLKPNHPVPEKYPENGCHPKESVCARQHAPYDPRYRIDSPEAPCGLCLVERVQALEAEVRALRREADVQALRRSIEERR